MESHNSVSGTRQFINPSYGYGRSAAPKASGSVSRRERAEEWVEDQRLRDSRVGRVAPNNTATFLQRQRKSGNQVTHEQLTEDIGMLDGNFPDGRSEYYVSKERLHGRTSREFDSPLSRGNLYEGGSQTFVPFTKPSSTYAKEDIWQNSSNFLSDWRQSLESHQGFPKLPQKNTFLANAGSKTVSSENFARGINSSSMKSSGRNAVPPGSPPVQIGPRMKQELDFSSGVNSSNYPRERADERLDGISLLPESCHNMWKNAYFAKGSGDASSPFVGTRNEYQQHTRRSSGNVSDVTNFQYSSPQFPSSKITANTSSLPNMEAYPQSQEQLRLALHGVGPGQKVAPSFVKHIPSNTNHASSSRNLTQGHFAYPGEKHYLNETLEAYIVDFRTFFDMIRDVDVEKPETQFLVEIGSVIERALKEVVMMRCNRFEVEYPYLEVLVKFIEVFLNYATLSVRKGLISTIHHQRVDQTNSQIDTNTRTSTTTNTRGGNSFLSYGPEGTVTDNLFLARVGDVSTPGFSVEGSQTNESSLARINSRGAIYTDTEPSQHSQYSARSHRSATVLDSSQTSGTKERNKVLNKTKGTKRSAPEQSSEDFEQQGVSKSTKPPAMRTDVIEPPFVSNSVSSSEIERTASNTFSNFKTGKDSSNFQVEDDIILKTKEQLDISTASLKKITEQATLFLNKLKERNLQLIRFSSQFGRRVRQADTMGTRSHSDSPEDGSRNTIEVIKLECENLKRCCRGLDVYICETDSCILVKCKVSSLPVRLPHLCIKLNSEDPDNVYGHSFEYCGIDLGELGSRVKDEFSKALRKYSLYINIITLIHLYWKIATDVTNSLMTDYRN
ncbi:hypothetical protein GpartN1_g532.t1 [Galdieria partita]|uniref:Uncharacterized protein n=1 Tax=Galdieria partita TaxID=83374 RepID=A0A9C7UMX6_9RHOD|nr:hypothetical protein GpartN1_g532.t1 [Galdieria partita]